MKKIICNISIFGFLAFVISWITIVNGFPLLFSDSGSYIAASLKHIILTLDQILPPNLQIYINAIVEKIPNPEYIISWNRPVFYSYFILPIHLGISLFPIVILQALIFLYILYLILKNSFQRFNYRDFIFITLMLTIFSSISWHSNMILPDFYAPLIVLLLFLLGFYKEKLTKLEIRFCYGMFLIMTSFHYSYLPLALGLVCVFLIFHCFWLLKNKATFNLHLLINRSFFLFLSIFIVIIMHISLNLIHYGKFTTSIGSEAFLIQKFLSDGTLKKYLAKNCDDNKYQLCKYKNNVSTNYLWNDNSLLHQIGVLQSRAESKEIIKNIVLNYPLLLLKNAGKSTWKQLKSFKIDRVGSISSQAVVHQIIKIVFPKSYQSHQTSLQNTNRVTFNNFFNQLNIITFYISLLLSCIFLLFAILEKDTPLIGLFVLISAALIFNATITGSLSGVFDRYQSRITWLVQLYALLGVFHFIYKGWYRRLIPKGSNFFSNQKINSIKSISPRS